MNNFLSDSQSLGVSSEEALAMLASLSKVYYCMYYLDLQKGTFVELSVTDNIIHNLIGEKGLSREKLGFMVEELVDADFIDEMKTFTDISTLDERLKDKNYITCEFIRPNTGWLQGYFIAGDRDEQGHLKHAFWAIRNINEEKEREAELFRKIDEGIIKQREQNRMLQKQYEIVESLSKDYLNVFNVDLENDTATIIKLDGYVTSGINDSIKMYSYKQLYRQYVKDRVYPEDKKQMLIDMSPERVIEKLTYEPEYVSSYRVLQDDEVHFYQFKYIKAYDSDGFKNIIAGYQNIDKVIQAAMERETLITKSETDIMTGILNRGSGEAKSTQVINSGCGGMFCILDLDKFKSINDTYGHGVGDKVLISVAQCLKNTFRDNDIVFRLGGDEFSVFMIGRITKEDGIKVLERLKENLDGIDISEMNGQKIEASLGATIVRPGDSISFETVYKKADICVYESKKIEGTYISFSD